jgi:hypothetical protein
MLIEAGFDIAFECPATTPMILQLTVAGSVVECRMKPAIVVDLLAEAGKLFCDVLEGFEDHRVDRLDLQLS